MASRFDKIKGITIEIGGDTTKLSQALKDVNKDLKDTQTDLKDIERLLKMDPGNIDLMRQKHEKLGDQIKDSKDKLDKLKDAQEQMNDIKAFTPEQQSQYDALQREIIETETNIKNLEKEYKGSTVFSALGEKFSATGEKLEKAGKSFLPATGAVTGLATAAVKTTADFDEAMSQVAAVSGATGDDFDALRDKAREMGASTKFSASEAAEAMNYMAMAGWKTEDMLSGIEGVMNLAAASGEELGTTSDIVTDALTAFGLTAADSGHFADILAAASSNANTNVSMMGETFKYAAPIAGALGFSAEDTAEAIGLMANAGIKSSQAGTSLRTIMNSLAGEVKFCGDNIGEVTVQTTNADGSMRELSDILADCRVAFSGLTESEAASAAEALVGKNAMSGFLALMNAGEGDIEKLSVAIASCDGTAGDMAVTMQDNLSGQLTILKSQLQELAISFGDLLMPVVREVVGWIQKFVDWLNNLDEPTKETVLRIGLLVAAIGPVLIAIGKLSSGIGAILQHPILAIIAAVVAAIVGLYMTNEDFRNALNTFFNDTLVPLGEFLIGKFKEAWDGLVTLWTEKLQPALVNLWNKFQTFKNDYLVPLVDYVKNFVIKKFKDLQKFWEETLLPAILVVAGRFKDFRDNYLVPLADYLKNYIIKRFKDLIAFWTEKVLPGLVSLWTKFQTFKNDYLVPLSDFLKNYIIKRFKDLTAFWTDTLKPGIESLWNKFQKFKDDFLVPLADMLKNILIKRFKDLFGYWENTLKPGIQSLWNKFQTLKNDFLIPLADMLKNILIKRFKDLAKFWTDTLKPGIESLWNKFQTFKNDYLVPLVDYLKNYIIKKFKDLAAFWTDTLKPGIESLWKKFQTLKEDYLTPLWTFLSDKLLAIFKSIYNYWSRTLKPGIRELWEKFEDFKDKHLVPVYNWLNETFGPVFDGIQTIMNGLITFITDVFQGKWDDAWDALSTTFKNVWSGFVNIAREPINKIIGFVNDMINGVETGLNYIIGGLNKISFTVPDWVPAIGGKEFGIDIDEVHWSRIQPIPEMAKGGILQNGQAIVAEAGPELITMQGNRAMVQPLTNTANNYNAGGITLNIYQQPGQNVNDLADLIMDRMDEVYTMKGAVFA